ncbi:cytochrome b N-terminal domain-containing protein [Singulisphaera acidiphila]|uniref:Cytochrome b subunit of the bc complex n=1 Tax=Singulisphaera acidiphila (strain ATCC BAA-1392 / DSM 18658 / VKM B-2454 / MOB10) TaxID=886293 RepID=L0DPI2_SINAD|nr:cytochrome b N-terminal domain-containing protein [Singulisphaera acidiphila]AGA30753.1 cytochrome b subunit of the bc complex [Singulisphaera acidiphila DSM 18658]
MFNKLANWLDNRTGYKALVHEALEEPIPGGARWRYVFGSALSTTFMIQLATGLLLMLSYSPSSATAWGSVFYISNKMYAGWFVRGIHHFGSQAMVVLLAMHLLQVLWAGAYRKPREVNWWFGMALMFLTLGFSLTGYLLPWDQKGYWATKVATNISGGAPVLGPAIQKIVVGGTEYGNQTITRFFGLHVGVLPTLFFLCLFAHVALFRRHGLTPPRNAEKLGRGTFWPEQLFMDSVASLAVFGVLLYLVLSEGGANLDAPADPSSANYPARPEWYFLSLFQMLKYFPGNREIIGTIIIPTAIMVVLLLLPLFDRVLPRKLAHFLACCFVFALVGGGGFLTVEAMRSDAANESFQADRVKADEARQRAILLASEIGVPPEGAAYVLRHDPLTHGRAVLDKKCLSCHYFDGKGQLSSDSKGQPVSTPQVASDLKDYGSYTWIRGLLENPRADAYFGKVPQCDGMAEWKKGSKLTKQELDDVARFVASFAEVPADMTPDEWVDSPGVANHPGLEVFNKDCKQCHLVVEGIGEGGFRDAPKLFAWGSPQWIARMIHKPGAPDLYGYLEKKDQMPAFTSEQLTKNDVNMLVRYLQNDYFGAKATSPETKVAVGKSAPH